MQKKKLSIIIPYYNAEKYCNELLKIIDKQITEDVQVILVDDGSKEPYSPTYKWLTVIRQKNGGASAARNTGLDNAVGKYVTFIDSDDLISEKYIKLIINKIDKEDFDYCYFSWDSFGSWKVRIELKSVEDEFPDYNLCCWNRCYKRDIIGKVRFNINKPIAEDAEFIREVQANCNKKTFIKEIMYHYRSDTPNSLTKRYNNGELSMSRVVYNYNHITKDMTWLLDEVIEENKHGEVIILTNNNEIPELKNYAMVSKPMRIKGTELRGEPTNLFIKLNIPIKTQICFWIGDVYSLGGMESFAYYFCKVMSEHYEITVLAKNIDAKQRERLSKYVNIVLVSDNTKIYCDTLLCSRMLSEPPITVQYNNKYQMIHCCKLPETNWRANLNNDLIIPVSDTVKNSYPEIENHPIKIINNLIDISEAKRPLRLISATRLTFEKGKKRMIKLANLLRGTGIPFIWTIFSNDTLGEEIPGVVYMKPTIDVVNYIKGNDYLVQLSDSEAWCYSALEALLQDVPVIITDLPVLKEVGILHDVNAKVLPLDMNDVNVLDIYNNIPKVNGFKYDNDEIIKQWKELFGEINEVNVTRDTSEDIVTIFSLKKYKDMELERIVNSGEKYDVRKDRASILIENGFAKLIQ